MFTFKQHDRMTCVCEGAGQRHAGLPSPDNRCFCFDGFHGTQ
jgi:hypothetical protein